MSTYNDSLQQTTAEILANLQLTMSKSLSKRRQDLYNLYYKQGAYNRAADKLQAVGQRYDFARTLDVQGVENDTLAKQLAATTAQFEQAAADSVTNVAVAASNVQHAANLIDDLTQTIGSAFGTVDMRDADTELFNMASDTKALLSDTAYNAARASQLGMDATRDTSEVPRSQITTAVTAAKNSIETLLNATESQFSKLAETRTADSKLVNQAAALEKAAAGVYVDSITECNALDQGYVETNAAFNFNLTAAAESSSEIVVDFEPFQQPFDTVPGTEASLPSANPDYFVLIVPVQDAPLLNLKKVTQLHSTHPELFIHVSAGGNHLPLDESKDLNGKPVECGTPYSVVLFAKLGDDYKQYVDDLSNMLSAPSGQFVLTYPLPHAENIAAPEAQISPAAAGMIVEPGFFLPEQATNIKFTLSDLEELPDRTLPSHTELRCILLPTNTPTTGTFQDFDDDRLIDRAPSTVTFCFDRSLAAQVSAANYELASMEGDPSPPGIYTATIDNTTTDNFGELLQPDLGYVVAVYTVVPDDNDKHAQFQPVVAYSESIVLRHSPKFESKSD